MSIAALVPVEEYLSTHYPDGDREYIDGRIVELPVPGCEHGFVQAKLASYLQSHYPALWVGTAIRVHVTPTRFRVPDIVAGPGQPPAGRAIVAPPLLIVEILSPEDRIEDLQAKLDEYFAWGVRFVWEVNPRTRRGYIHTPGTRREAADGILRTADPEIAVPLAELY